MERFPEEPDTENVAYLDEYPELRKKVWLRRLNEDRELGRTALTKVTRIYQFPTVTEIPRPHPDQPA